MRDRGSLPTSRVMVRAYRDADLEGCLAVFASNVPRYFTMRERDEFMGFLQSLPGPYLVLDAGPDGIVGCGGIGIVADRADLCWGMVREDLHMRGLGRLLTEARLARALAEPRVASLALNTSHLTTGFYERLGFTVTECTENGYAPGLHRCEMRADAAVVRAKLRV